MEKVISNPIKRIALLGPESSGKSTLAFALAEHFSSGWVPEFAREYLANKNGQYQYADLTKIAQGQLASEQKILQEANQFLFCDTELLTIKIWSEAKFKICHQWIEKELTQQTYDLYLLCKPDFDWCPDPLRENPTQGAVYFELYQKALLERKWPFKVMAGPHDTRLKQAIEAVLEV